MQYSGTQSGKQSSVTGPPALGHQLSSLLDLDTQFAGTKALELCQEQNGLHSHMIHICPGELLVPDVVGT